MLDPQIANFQFIDSNRGINLSNILKKNRKIVQTGVLDLNKKGKDKVDQSQPKTNFSQLKTKDNPYNLESTLKKPQPLQLNKILKKGSNP